jgi:hypothetical protein
VKIHIGSSKLGIEARASAPQQIAARLKSDIDMWRKVIDKAGIPKHWRATSFSQIALSGSGDFSNDRNVD